MTEQELLYNLKRDLEFLGLPLNDVDIIIANKYVKTYYGLYYPKTNKRGAFIRIYPYMYPSNDCMYSYTHLLDTTIHEMCHHLQYSDDNYIRVIGVVHDSEFWELYNKYITLAKEHGLM